MVWGSARPEQQIDTPFPGTLHESGIACIVIQRNAQFLQDDVEASVEVNKDAFRPKLLPQFLGE